MTSREQARPRTFENVMKDTAFTPAGWINSVLQVTFD